jgi:hypothetical protein
MAASAPTAAVFLSTGTDSPVSADSSMRRLRAPEQPHVGRHAVAGRQQHHVPWHQLGGVDVVLAAVAQHHGVRRQHVADGLQRLLGLALLHEADHRIEDHHRHDDAGVHPVTHQRGHQCSGHQHVEQQVVELPRQPLQQAGRLDLGQAVGAMAAQARLGLGPAQAMRVAVLRLQRVSDAAGVPGWRVGGGRRRWMGGRVGHLGDSELRCSLWISEHGHRPDGLTALNACSAS